MRVGIITQSYYPIAGGVTEHVYYQARHLQEMGHQPTIITSRFLRTNNYNHDEIGRRLQRICRKKQFDIVHIHSPLDPILPLLAVYHIKQPKVGTFHSYSNSALLFDFGRKPINEMAHRLGGRIAVSEAAKEFHRGYFPGDYSIIPNGVDTGRFSQDAKPLERFDDDFFNILFVGRMAPRKGLKNLLRALPPVLSKYPKTRLIIVGDGILRGYYRLFYPSWISDRVFFEGYIPRSQLARYYASADLYCSPATGGESFGIVLLEAMASGLPIVASAIRGYSEVVTNEQEALLVPPDDPLVISNAIIRLIEDKKLRDKLSHNGLAKAKEYSWEMITRRLVDFYGEVLEKTKK
jgi:phosphatidylinositol alpha-mannosyltransferase